MILSKITGFGRQTIEAIKYKLADVSREAENSADYIAAISGKGYTRVLTTTVTADENGEVAGNYQIPAGIRNFRIECHMEDGGFDGYLNAEGSPHITVDTPVSIITLLDRNSETISFSLESNYVTAFSLSSTPEYTYSGGAVPGSTGYIKIYY